MRELTSLSESLNSRIIENCGELTPETEAELIELDLQTREKVDAYSYVIKRAKFEANFWKEEAEAAMANVKGFLKLEEWYKQAIKNRMLVDNTKEVLGNKTKFMLVPLNPKMLIDEKFLEDRFYREEVLKKIDRSLIEEAIRQGEAVAGVTLEPVYALRPSKKGPSDEQK